MKDQNLLNRINIVFWTSCLRRLGQEFPTCQINLRAMSYICIYSLLRVTGCVVVFKRLQQNPKINYTIKILYETSTQYTLSPVIIYFLFYSVVILFFPDNSRGGDLSSRRYCSVIDCAAIIAYSMVGDISWMYFCIWLKKTNCGESQSHTLCFPVRTEVGLKFRGKINNFLILIKFFFDRENFLMTFDVRRRYPEIIFRKFFDNSTTVRH